MVDNRRRETVTWNLVVLLAICIYFILLMPYVVHANLSHSGLVVSSEYIPLESLPEGIRSFIIFEEKPVVVLIKQQMPIWIDRSVTEWTIALITTEKFPSGSFIEFVSPVARMYVNWRDYPFGQIFDELVIADVVGEVQQFEVNIEYLLSSPYGSLVLALSMVNYYFGPFIFVLIAIIIKKRPTLWSIVIIPWCYSASTLIYNTFAIQHYNYVPEGLRYFGYLSIALTPLVLFSWAYERTPRGKALVEKLFTFSKE